MKVSGFTIVRNAVRYDYPICEAIASVLPLCDEFIVLLGNSTDDTDKLLRSSALTNVKVLHSTWDDSLRTGGRVLAVETDKAFAATAKDSDWCIYIQADEVIHEQFLPTIRAAMHEHLSDPRIDCLVLKYLHFYGSYDYIGAARHWYRREIRIIRRDASISSYRDAQGFRRHGAKLRGKLVNAYVYHYGWVRTPTEQQRKMEEVSRLWHTDEEIQRIVVHASEYDYSSVNNLQPFLGTHPAVMQQRINRMNWQFHYDSRRRHISLKERILLWIERRTGRRLFEFRNYKLI